MCGHRRGAAAKGVAVAVMWATRAVKASKERGWEGGAPARGAEKRPSGDRQYTARSMGSHARLGVCVFVSAVTPCERVDDLSAERKGAGTSLEAEAKAEKHHQEKNGLDGMNGIERTKPGIHQLSGWSVQSVESVQSVLVSSLVFRRTSAAACRPREAIRSTARSTARRRTSHRSGRADCRRRGGPARVRDRASSGFDRAPR